MRWHPLTPEEVAAVWTGWRAGTPQRVLARALGRPAGTIDSVIRTAGGLPPRPRRRAARSLTLTERETIACGLAAGCSLRALGRQLGRAPSTLSREVQRHGGPARVSRQCGRRGGMARGTTAAALSVSSATAVMRARDAAPGGAVVP
jgi:hypothetical protein